MSRFAVSKGMQYTHTSIIKPSGSFYVSPDDMDDFMARYTQAYLAGEDLYMTEKHRDIGPFLIDLDFRFDKEVTTRKYNIKDIEGIVKIYATEIAKYVDVPEYTIYLMEKSGPVADKKFMKDGIHIVIPDIVTPPSVQYIIRKNVLADIATLLSHLGLKNQIEDVVDEAVIERNNWQMYGSKKPSGEAYKVTGTFTVTPSGIKYTNTSVGDPTLFSIRNKFDASKLKIEKAEEVKEFEQKRRKPTVDMNKPMFKQNLSKNECENIEWVGKIVDILKADRADSYDTWIRTGWCLRNIDHRLLDKWIDFSKKSEKFEDGVCERYWNMMRDDGLSIGTLCMWAKQDNPDVFKELMEQDLHALIISSKTETHYDIAKVVHFMFKYDYVCVNNRNNTWYEFKDHRWCMCDGAYSLRASISTDVFREYQKAIGKINLQSASPSTDSDAQQRNAELTKKLNNIALKLKQSPFKDNIIKECRELFYIEKFEEKLDSKCHLIGFENGVYDLESFEFREGRPDDYVSMSTRINYVPYDATHEAQVGINKIISTIFVKPHIREYVMKLMGSFLNGSVREEKFHIWTGCGSNGKSVIVEFFEMAFGEYCCKFPITLLTMKRASSNAPTPEIARSKGRRFAVLQEPSEDEKMNVGLMKELTGGDKIIARQLHKDPIEFKPQFKMVLTCNHLPNVPSDDGGTWRRIRVVEFTSRFCENPNPENPNEFMMDKDLRKKMEEWQEHFMSLLIEYYKKYVVEGIKEPDEVLKCTRDYQRSNDIMMDFYEQEIEKRPGDAQAFVTVTDVFQRFQTWVKDNAPQMKSTITRKNLRIALEKHLKLQRLNGAEAFLECKLKTGDMFGMADDDL